MQLVGPLYLLSLFLWLQCITIYFILSQVWSPFSLEPFVIPPEVDVDPRWLGSYLISSSEFIHPLSFFIVGRLMPLGVDWLAGLLGYLTYYIEFIPLPPSP